MAAGDFSASVFPEVLMREEEIWKGGNQDFTTSVNSINAIVNKQTANISPILGDPTRDKNVKIWFSKFDAAIDGTKACENTCSPTGTELETDSETFTLQCVQAQNIAIKVTGGTLTNGMSYAEQLTRSYMKQKMEIKKFFNTEGTIGFISGIAGLNGVPAGALAKVDTNDTLADPKTYVAEADWTADRFADFEVIANVNNFKNRTMLHFYNFISDFRNFELNALSADQKEQWAKLNLFTHVTDPNALTSAALLADNMKSSFLLNNDELAFGTKHYNTSLSPSTEGRMADDYAWYSKDDRLDNGNIYTGGVIKGLTFDHFLKRTCVPGTNGRDFVDLLQTQSTYVFAKSRRKSVIEIVKGLRA